MWADALQQSEAPPDESSDWGEIRDIVGDVLGLAKEGVGVAADISALVDPPPTPPTPRQQLPATSPPASSPPAPASSPIWGSSKFGYDTSEHDILIAGKKIPVQAALFFVALLVALLILSLRKKGKKR